MATVSALAARHPSRAIVVSPADPDGPTTFDAHIYAACQVRSQSEICTEEILIKTGGELSQHLATAVAPLLIHDLPVVLWWPDDVPFGSKHFMELAEECDRLLVDSGQFRGDGVERLVGPAPGRGGWPRGPRHRLDARHALARAAGGHLRPPAADARAHGHPQRPHRHRQAGPHRAPGACRDVRGVARGHARMERGRADEAGRRLLPRRLPGRQARDPGRVPAGHRGHRREHPLGRLAGPRGARGVARARHDAGPRDAPVGPPARPRPTGTAPRWRAGPPAWIRSTRCPSWPRRSTGRATTGSSSGRSTAA